jgi:hypothetical protein
MIEWLVASAANRPRLINTWPLANPATDAITARITPATASLPGDARHLWQHATDAELRSLASTSARASTHT